MKAISIPQPWAQLVISGCKRFFLSDIFPFEDGEAVLVFASDYDPLADENGCSLASFDRMLIENARIFGYLTEDELPTNSFIGCVQVSHHNKGEDVSVYTCWLPQYLCIGDKKGPAEIEFENPRAFFKSIPFISDLDASFFDAPLKPDELPESFAFRQFGSAFSKIFVPCSLKFLNDIADLEEYVYSIYLLPELQRQINRITHALPLIPDETLRHLIDLEERYNAKFITLPHDITFMTGKYKVTFLIKNLSFEPSVVDTKTKVAIFHLVKHLDK